MNIVVTVIAILLIDKVGRKALLLVGSAGMTLSLGVLTFIFSNAPLVLAADGSMTPDLSGSAAGTAAQ